MTLKLNSYNLSRCFFNFCFENPDVVKPSHIAIYFYIIEHCNRLGWKAKFGLPSMMVREVCGIKNFRTYDKALKDLVSWKFIKIISISSNQYTSNIIALTAPKLNDITNSTSALDASINLSSIIFPEDENNTPINVTDDNNTTPHNLNVSQRIILFEKKVMYEGANCDLHILISFIKYWSQLSTDKLYFRAESQEFFNIPDRLKKWLELEVKFNKNSNANAKNQPATHHQIISTLDAKFANLKDF